MWCMGRLMAGFGDLAAQVARSVQLLEVVAAGAAEELAWPAPSALEMQTCDFPQWAKLGPLDPQN